MIYEYGDMFSIYDSTDLFVITTNSTIKSNGALVMGRGIAKQVRDKFKDVDKDIGAFIYEICGSEGLYGFRPSPNFPQGKLGIFQVKYHYADKASLTLIHASTVMLRDWAKEHSDIRIDMNYPGIGYGGLSIITVEPFVQMLPDNVHVWRFEKPKVVKPKKIQGYTPTPDDFVEMVNEVWDFADGMP